MATQTVMRPLLRSTAVKAAGTILLAASSSLAFAAYAAGGGTPVAWVGVFLTFAGVAASIPSGSSAANLISLVLSGQPHRPGGISPGEESESQLWVGPYSRTQIALLALMFLSLVVSVVAISDFPSTAISFAWALLGFAIGVWYRI